jgi:hypothetical protein
MTDWNALANRLADFRFGSTLKPDGTPRDSNEWLEFEPVLMRALRDQAEVASLSGSQGQWQPPHTAPSGTLILICDMTATELRYSYFVDWLIDGMPVMHPKRTCSFWQAMPPHPERLPPPPADPTEKA